MAAAVAHELNQPLTALSAYAASVRLLLESSGIHNQVLLDTADKIRRSAVRAADIVSRFRGLLATGEPTLLPTAISGPAWDAICSCKERADMAGIRLTLDAPPALPLVRTDPARIEIVFRNLIGNAIDSVERTATTSRLVSVTIERDGSSYLVMTISDSGRGIPATCAERVFEPFFSETPSGMGLGLALSRAIVERNGGRLWAEPGNHGIFKFSLPL
jgi:two-component system, LuxR family, sensor kinase FixL